MQYIQYILYIVLLLYCLSTEIILFVKEIKCLLIKHAKSIYICRLIIEPNKQIVYIMFNIEINYI